MIQRDQADLSRGKLLIKSCGKALQGWEHTFWFSFPNKRLLGRKLPGTLGLERTKDAEQAARTSRNVDV